MPRVLGVDHGEKRLGFAVSDPTGIVATPLCVVHCTGPRDALRETRRVCRESGAEKIVVGMPLNMDGSRGPVAQRVEAYVEELSASAGVPVVTWDERLSTRAAENVLIEAGASRQRRKEVIDKLAAQIMLQSYLDAQATQDLADRED
jgi:putative holliday junction resolvase